MSTDDSGPLRAALTAVLLIAVGMACLIGMASSLRPPLLGLMWAAPLAALMLRIVLGPAPIVEALLILGGLLLCAALVQWLWASMLVGAQVGMRLEHALPRMHASFVWQLTRLALQPRDWLGLIVAALVSLAFLSGPRFRQAS